MGYGDKRGYYCLRLGFTEAEDEGVQATSLEKLCQLEKAGNDKAER